MTRNLNAFFVFVGILAILLFSISNETFARGYPFSISLEPTMSHSFDSGSGMGSFRNAPAVELTFKNETNEEVCLDLNARGFKGEICVPANQEAMFTKLFDGTVTVTNRSSVATIIIRGRWL